MPDFNILDAGNMSTIDEEVIQEYLDKRVLILNQGIDDEIIEKYILRILSWNLEDMDIPKEKRKPIHIYVNCCGGDVFSGLNFIDVIQSSVTPIYAVGFSFVASMGFLIYIACDKRYAFKNTTLLMHDGDISISNSSSKAKDTMKFVDNMELREKEHVLRCTKITEEFYDEHYNNETFMFANEEAKELGCVDYIIGEDVTINEILGA